MTTRKALAAAALVSATAIPIAAARGGKPHGHQACKPNVSVMLKGRRCNADLPLSAATVDDVATARVTA